MVSQVLVRHNPLRGRFAQRSLVALKPLAALVQLLDVLEVCIREAVVPLHITTQEAVGDTMEEQEEDSRPSPLNVVVVGVQAILQALFLSMYRVFMLEMEMLPLLLSTDR